MFDGRRAGGEGRRHTVRDEQRRVRDRFVLSPGIEQIHRVVRVEVEEARNDGLGIGDDDAVGVWCGDRQVSADAQDFPGANENSWISHTSVARGREEPTAVDEDIAFLCGRELCDADRQEQCNALDHAGSRREKKGERSVRMR